MKNLKITIEIDDEELRQCIKNEVAKNIARESWTMNRKIISDTVKEVIYSRKDEFIEKCVSRASTELAKKALPKLMQKITESGG